MLFLVYDEEHKALVLITGKSGDSFVGETERCKRNHQSKKMAVGGFGLNLKKNF